MRNNIRESHVYFWRIRIPGLTVLVTKLPYHYQENHHILDLDYFHWSGSLPIIKFGLASPVAAHKEKGSPVAGS